MNHYQDLIQFLVKYELGQVEDQVKPINFRQCSYVCVRDQPIYYSALFLISCVRVILKPHFLGIGQWPKFLVFPLHGPSLMLFLCFRSWEFASPSFLSSYFFLSSVSWFLVRGHYHPAEGTISLWIIFHQHVVPHLYNFGRWCR